MGWGDEIMVTGIARRNQEKNHLPVRVLDKLGRSRWSDIWKGNPRLAALDFKGDVQTLTNGPGRRPYVERETPARWHWRDWICPIGEIHFDQHERLCAAKYTGRVIVEPHLKSGASPNKDWGWARWVELTRELTRRGHAVAQFGGPGAVQLPGVELIHS